MQFFALLLSAFINCGCQICCTFRPLAAPEGDKFHVETVDRQLLFRPPAGSGFIPVSPPPNPLLDFSTDWFSFTAKHLNVLYAATPSFVKIHCNIISPSTSRSPNYCYCHHCVTTLDLTNLLFIHYVNIKLSLLPTPLKAYWGSRGITLFILNLNNRASRPGRSVRRKKLRYSLSRQVGGTLAAELVWVIGRWEEKFLASAEDRTPAFSAHNCSHYTDCAVCCKVNTILRSAAFRRLTDWLCTCWCRRLENLLLKVKFEEQVSGSRCISPEQICGVSIFRLVLALNRSTCCVVMV